MRGSIATLLLTSMVTFGLASVGQAQPARAAVLNGQIVDAGGRGSSGRSIELVSGGTIVGITTSGTDGHFSFALGSPGLYTVRTVTNGEFSGVRVSVVKGQNPPVALLVLPSAVTAAPQIGAAISGSLSALVSVAGVVVTTATSELINAIETRQDDEILADPQTRQDTVTALNAIIQQISPGAPAVTLNPTTGAIVIPPTLATVINNPVITTAIVIVATSTPASGGGN